MALAQRMDVRQAQGLVMTPQLQQAIKLLQMSNLELSAFVDSELERNPILEREDADNSAEAPEPPAPAEMPETELHLREDAPAPDAPGALDTEADNLYPDEATPHRDDGSNAGLNDWSSVKGGGRLDSDDAFSLEATLSQELSLRDHLLAQVPNSFSDPADRLIAAYLVDMIDEAGYLTGSVEDAASSLGAPVSRIEAVLSRILRLDPTGAGARTLAECLRAQLEERDRFDPAMAAVIANLDLLAKRDLAGLMRAANVDAEDLKDIIAEIKSLTPKPGLKFGSVAVTPVIPDIFVRDSARGGYQVELNADTLPRVLINSRYMASVNANGGTKEVKTYLTECVNSATWLIKSLDQRAKTILKVASEIVRQQDAFFAYGVQHLRPLNLRIVADAIGMHESTVSRVTNNKYMATPRGLFELKYFFTASIASAEGGEAHSAEAVRYQIKDLIDREAANAVLSDDRIVEILRQAGVDIARRTVAKYREALRIPSSVERRRLKAEAGCAISTPVPGERSFVTLDQARANPSVLTGTH